MKTFKSIIFLGLCFCLTFVNAQQQVSREEAVNAAITTLKYHSVSQSINPSIDTVYSYFRNGKTLIYEVHFNTGEIVLLSGNRNCLPVLGYVASNDELEETHDAAQHSILSLDEKCPDGLKVFIEEYINQIEYCFTHSMTYSYASQWSDLQQYDENRTRNIILISPLTTTKWGQRESNDANNFDIHAYNYYSPTGSNCNYYCYAGCGPVALAQILRYWQSPFYVPRTCHYYHWSNMPDELLYDGGNNNDYEIQRNAIAQLIRDCGDALVASYCNDNCETSAKPDSVVRALKKFRFNDACYYTESQAGSHSNWVNLLKQELFNNRPIFYAAYSSPLGEGGHGFVCDGYYKDVYDNEYFYFNWGWNGDYNNAYFTLPSLNPGSHNYQYNHRAIFNIHPSNCWENAIFGCDNNFSFYNASYTAEETIQNDNHIFSVSQESTVILKAGEEIILTDGFYAGGLGVIFLAKIEACAPDDLDMMANVDNNGMGERGLGGRTQNGRTRCVPTTGR